MVCGFQTKAYQGSGGSLDLPQIGAGEYNLLL